jgi:hypothetical protein
MALLIGSVTPFTVKLAASLFHQTEITFSYIFCGLDRLKACHV